MDEPTGVVEKATVIQPGQGEAFGFGGVGGHWTIQGPDTDDRFAVAHLPEIPPKALGAPLHCHHQEDEFSHVLEGRLGVLIGDQVLTVEAGSWIFKPRGRWHTFWNAGDEACHVMKIVSPAGFESYFREVAAARGDLERLAELNERHSIDMDLESIPDLCERFGLTFPELGG